MSKLILNDKPGLTLDQKTEAKRKFDALRENQRKLDACAKHHFPNWPEVLTMGTKFECANCGGGMDAIHTYSYTKGYQAAGGNPVDIIPTWYETFGKDQQANSVVKGDNFKEDESNA